MHILMTSAKDLLVHILILLLSISHWLTHLVKYLSALENSDSPTKVPSGGLVCGGAVGACLPANEVLVSVSRDLFAELLICVDLFE